MTIQIGWQMSYTEVLLRKLELAVVVLLLELLLKLLLLEFTLTLDRPPVPEELGANDRHLTGSVVS